MIFVSVFSAGICARNRTLDVVVVGYGGLWGISCWKWGDKCGKPVGIRRLTGYLTTGYPLYVSGQNGRFEVKLRLENFLFFGIDTTRYGA